MADYNYWKDRYQHEWAKASQREAAIILRIKQETGRTVMPVGLGAGKTTYLPGSAKSQGHEKGGADLRVEGTNIYLEVTGPQSARVSLRDPLWLRPDKIASARRHHPAHETWVIHWLEKDGTLRTIQLDQDFFARVDKGEFRTVVKQIRGSAETYVEIPAGHPCVRPWQVLIERLKHIE